MASKNENLHAAKKAKNDEFYTRLEDIEKEVQHYWPQLKGKKVFCPCDDYRWSAFVDYFRDNYHQIGLAGLTATNFDIGDGAWKYEFDGKTGTVTELLGNGNFRSEEITAIKDEWADVVITNPPFSLWRDFFNWLND